MNSNRFSNDNCIELTKLQENYSNTIPDNHIKRYMQSLSYNPYSSHKGSLNAINIVGLKLAI